MTQSEQTEILAAIQQLMRAFQTVLLSTCSVDAAPEISYSPYAVVEGKLYIFLSDLARHTANLKNNPKASLLFIESEADAKNLHARTRVTFKAQAEIVDRESEEAKNALAAMESRFGQIMQLLASLPDFHFFALTTQEAVLVRGFADAHPVSCDGFPE